MPDWIKYRIPKKLLDNKNKNIKIEEFNESKHKDIILKYMLMPFAIRHGKVIGIK